MMNIIKFYYFGFLYYSKQKAENPYPWLGSILSLVLTFFFITALLYAFLEYFFFLPIPINTLRIYVFGYCTALVYVLYQSLVKGGKSEKIYDEFISHPWNTKKNRIACFVILFASNLIFMGAVAALKGYIKF